MRLVIMNILQEVLWPAADQPGAVAVSLFAILQLLNENITELCNACLIFHILYGIVCFLRILTQIKVLFLSGFTVPDEFILLCDDVMIGEFIMKAVLSMQIASYSFRFLQDTAL